MLYYVEGFRFFHTCNIGSVGQSASKLLAVKVGVLKKKSATLAIPLELYATAFSPSLRTPEVKSFSKFDGW